MNSLASNIFCANVNRFFWTFTIVLRCLCAFAIYRTVTRLSDSPHTSVMASALWQFCLAIHHLSFRILILISGVPIAASQIRKKKNWDQWSGEESGHEKIQYWIIETKVMTRLKVKVYIALRCVVQWLLQLCHRVIHMQISGFKAKS